MDYGKHGSMREIEQTDLRNLLLFMAEYPQWKNTPAEKHTHLTPVDQVSWL